MRQTGIQLIADKAGNFNYLLLYSFIPTLNTLQRTQCSFINNKAITLQETDNFQTLTVDFIKQHTIAQNTVRQQLAAVVNQFVIIVAVSLR